MIRAFRRWADGPPEEGWTLLETLAAVVVIGIGIALFLRMQTMTRARTKFNSNLLKAGQIIESQIDSIRTFIARDTLNNWNSFTSTTSASSTIGAITLTRTVSAAASPEDGSNIPNVRKVKFKAVWGSGAMDSLAVTTYVSQRF